MKCLHHVSSSRLLEYRYPSVRAFPGRSPSSPICLVRAASRLRVLLTAPERYQSQKTSQLHNFTTSPRLHTTAQKRFALLQTSPELTMAPKRNAREQTPSSTATTQPSSPAAASVSSLSSKASHKSSSNQSPQQIALGIWQNYLDTTPQRTKLIDVFMAFLVVVGGLQFVYCVIAGNYVRIVD